MNRAFADNDYYLERFIEVDETVLARPDISDSAKLLWLVIAMFAKYGEPAPSNAALAEACGWNVSKVKQVLTKLETAGILTRTFETADGSLHRTALRVLQDGPARFADNQAHSLRRVGASRNPSALNRPGERFKGGPAPVSPGACPPLLFAP